MCKISTHNRSRNRVFHHYYVPDKQLSDYESLARNKNHTSLIQYLLKKQHHRWGIKLWVMCDLVINYCLGFFVHRGKGSTKRKWQSLYYGKNTIGDGELSKQRIPCVYVDDFFPSIPSARYLYSVGTYITRTIRLNQKFLLTAVKTKFGERITHLFKNGCLMLCGYKEKNSKSK